LAVYKKAVSNLSETAFYLRAFSKDSTDNLQKLTRSLPSSLNNLLNIDKLLYFYLNKLNI